MASRAATATMSDLAMKRLLQAMKDINAAYPEVEPAVMPSYRDIRYQEAARYDALASYAERLAVAMGVSSVPAPVEEVEIVEDEIDNSDDGTSDYSQYTNKQLRTMAEERGINAAPLRNKAELIDALEAADGLTEDEQEAKHEAAGEPS